MVNIIFILMCLKKPLQEVCFANAKFSREENSFVALLTKKIPKVTLRSICWY